MIKMITFSCKKISKEELIRCAFALNKTEYNLLMFLLKEEKQYTIFQIAELMKLDRTTIQKAIKKLVTEKLVKRIQRNLSRGGYTFLYAVNDKKNIKDKIKKAVHEWYKNIEIAINKM